MDVSIVSEKGPIEEFEKRKRPLVTPEWLTFSKDGDTFVGQYLGVRRWNEGNGTEVLGFLGLDGKRKFVWGNSRFNSDSLSMSGVKDGDYLYIRYNNGGLETTSESQFEVARLSKDECESLFAKERRAETVNQGEPKNCEIAEPKPEGVPEKPLNSSRGPPRGHYPERWELYGEGLSDSAIGRELGVSEEAIRCWRIFRGLPANNPSKNMKKFFPRRRELYENGLNDHEIAEVEGTRPHAILKWRWSRGLPANRVPNLPPISSDSAKKFIERLELKMKKETVQSYGSTLRMFEKFLGEKPIEEATVKDIQDFLDSRKKEHRARATIRMDFCHIKRFYDYTWTFLNIPPPRLMEVDPNYNREPWEGAGRSALSRREIRILVEAADNDRDALLIWLTYEIGARAGGVSNLKLEDVDTDSRRIELLEKGDKQRVVNYPPELDRLIRRWLVVRKSYAGSEKSPYFFVTKSGGRLQVGEIWEIVHKLAWKAGIQEVVYEKPDGTKIYKLKTHVFRHCHVTHAKQDGVPEDHIRRYVGHDRIETTRGYMSEPMEDVYNSYKKFRGIRGK